MYKRKKKNNPKGIYFPIFLVISYLFITQLAYLYIYEFNNDVFITLLYTSINYFSLFLGYLISNTRVYRFYVPNYNINKLLVLFSIITIITSLNNIRAFYPSYEIILEYIVNPGKAYEYVKFMNRHQLSVRSTTTIGSILGILLTILSFAKYYVFGFTIFYWRKINKKLKTLSIIAILVYIFHAFLIGAMINIAVLFIAVLPFILNILFNNKKKETKDIKKYLKWIYVLLFGLAIFITILYFMGSRNVFKLSDGKETTILISGLLGLLFYISHGYVGLSQCLNLPFVFTWGHTTFRGVIETIAPYIGWESLFNNSYLIRNQMETGTEALQVWSTIFPWIASDISFILIPFIMIVIGFFMRNIWKESLIEQNPYALVAMGQLFILCFMIPANNQLFHTFGNATTTIIIFLFYFISRKKF